MRVRCGCRKTGRRCQTNRLSSNSACKDVLSASEKALVRDHSTSPTRKEQCSVLLENRSSLGISEGWGSVSPTKFQDETKFGVGLWSLRSRSFRKLFGRIHLANRGFESHSLRHLDFKRDTSIFDPS
jgi:hypothetical protein